ncbi:hypothetical protein IA539_19680 [Gordonia sp. zg691]|uniref:Uncharacterized protein n=1 Tax=Gordonia jinghuaiqii TaxID=2758710 RepID=A0A7D7QZ76_9ACTN|nr:hypothetical protein [Gordonia jinghuaiqii]MBD0863398.1 hypothetical protein [Gordonia jinghuaiqii]MCR5979130.1 hypothetical protein [Gordonia jinghuaiqii]QMT00931.1 hypothetical protein H1R19_18980 [Gordonia jinghuaiqii]
MSDVLADGQYGLGDQTAASRVGLRLTDRGTAVRQTLVSAALFLPVLAWWPTVLWLFTFDPLNGTAFPEYYAAFQADGPAVSLILIWVLTALMPLYMVIVLGIWARGPVRSAIAVAIGAVGALGFWGGQVPILVRSGEYAALTFCSDHTPAFVLMLIVAWSVARRRGFWWVLAIPVIALLAINAYEGWTSNPLDALVDRTGSLLGVPTAEVLDPFSPRYRSPFDDVVDIIAGISTLWVVDSVFGALSRQGRVQASPPETLGMR